MPDEGHTLKQDLAAARKALGRLRDAFEQMTGTPTNVRSRKALQMLDTLREWEEEFGAGTLEARAQEHEAELMNEHGSASDPDTE